MSTENPGSQTLPKLLSVPGLVSLAVFGVLVVVKSRLFGLENILKEVVTELLASFGSTILLIAVFGLVFKSGLRRLLRATPGGETLSKSAERLSELLQEFDQGGWKGARDEEEKLDRIEESIRGLKEDEIPALRDEIRELREALEGGRGEDHTPR